MKIVSSLSEVPPLPFPLFLTIGNFDGVHQGHRSLLQTIHKQARGLEGGFVILSFSNHPSTVLHPERRIPCICTHIHKEKLLEKEGADVLVHLPFTEELAKQSARTFLLSLRKNIPFTHLVLGFDNRIGKNREGDIQQVCAIGKEESFAVEYLPEQRIGDEVISSTTIRKKIGNGEIETIAPWLGRPYSIYGPVIRGEGLGKQIGFPTVNIAVDGLVLPPFGVYLVSVYSSEKMFPGIANLGIAPTVHEERKPLLEVHLLEPAPDIDKHPIEVIFHQFVRPEKAFSRIEELQAQIQTDIGIARDFFSENT